MNRNLASIVFLFLISILFSALAIHFAVHKGRKTPLLRKFLWVQILLLVWTSGDCLRLFFSDYFQRLIIVMLEYSAICFISFAWLLFCLNYVESPFLTKKNLILLAILPSFSYLALLSNQWHHLFFTATDRNFNQLGSIFFLHAFGSYLYCLMGTGVLFQYSLRQFRHMRKQGILLMIASLIPLLVNFSVVFRWINWKQFDFTPLSFNVSSLILIFGIFRYRFLDIIPIALRRIVDHMREAIVVIDLSGRIVEFNMTLVKAFPELGKLQPGASITQLASVLRERGASPGLLEKEDYPDDEGEAVTREIYLEKTNQYFSINMQAIRNGNNLVGWIISFNDVSVYQKLLDELNLKNMELTTLNHRLEAHARTVEELAVVKERNRLARDMHDTLGQNMTLVVTLLQICKMYCHKDPTGIEAKLEEALQFAIRGQEQARQALYGMSHLNVEKRKATEILEPLVTDFGSSHVAVNLAVDGEEYQLSLNCVDTIYRLVQEACTNAVRHGRASKIDIQLHFEASRLILKVRDNGKGCSQLQKGMGLTGMEERIEAICGKVSFTFSPGAGFTVRAEFPQKRLVT